MPAADWIATAAVLVALAGLVLALAAWRLARKRPPSYTLAVTRVSRPRTDTGSQVAVVLNPSKPGATAALLAIDEACQARGLTEPLVLETTIEETGAAQARAALDAGATLVIVTGGDGTVRAAASAMLGSRVPMAIIPAGTGNLFARNLNLPLANIDEAVAIALAGLDRSVDVGWVRVLETELGLDGKPRHTSARVGDKQMFLVIAGLGFDAAMVADTDEALKRRFGWLAYFLAGAKHLHSRRMHASVWLDSAAPIKTRLRSVMIGNCGRIPGGIALLPDAKMDDGVLDLAAVDTRVGLAGWTQLLGTVILRRTAGPEKSAYKWGRINRWQCRRARIKVSSGEHAQVDGDCMGKVREIEVWVEPGALLVRAP